VPRSVEREKVRFVSGGTECAAWHYQGTNGACVIMAGGFAVTELSFLRRHLLDHAPADRPGSAPADSARHGGGRP
jgi:hypothetical protein